MHSNCTYCTLKIKQVGIPVADVTHIDTSNSHASKVLICLVDVIYSDM
jgi:hypothetical protein